MPSYAVETSGPVTLVRLQRGKANAFDPAFVTELTDLAADLAEGAGGVVLTGQGGFFSTGLDLGAVSALDRADFTDFMRDFSTMAASWFALPRPVVCAINGHAIAGGCIVSQVGDLRIGARGGYRIGANEVALGVPFPAAAMRLFAFQLGEQRAFRVTSGAALYLPDDALAHGLLDELADDAVAVACERAEAQSRHPPRAYALNKSYAREPVLRAMWDLDATLLDGFVDCWFGPARPLVEAAVARLRAPRG